MAEHAPSPADGPPGPVQRHTLLARVSRALRLDFHVVATLLFRGWSVVAGGLTILLVPLWLSPVEQGYYYTFAGLVALQVFFELGVNYVVLQMVSHEFTHLERHADGRLIGDGFRIARLFSLMSVLRRWYRVAAVFFLLLVGGAGTFFFARRGELGFPSWIGAWLVLTTAVAFNLYFSVALAAVEGAGRVGQVARLRMTQSIVGYGGMWVALCVGAALWAVPIPALTAAFGTLYWLKRHDRTLQQIDAQGRDEPRVTFDWRTEVFPMQWRVALSWMSGYLIFNLFTPVMFAHQGAVEAGRIGITLTIFTTLLTLGMSWITARTPEFVAHIARGERNQLDQLFFALLKRSMGFTVIASLIVLAGAFALSSWNPTLAARLSSLPVMVCIALTTIVNNFVFAAAAYMRAHKEEPMLVMSITMGLLSAAVIFFVSRSSVLMTMSLYAAITVAVSLPWTAALLRRHRLRFASTPAAAPLLAVLR